jgi:mRNA interferase RelE/StbE
MNYQIVFTKNAVKDINKLDFLAKKRLKKKLELLCQDPLTVSKKLIDSKLGQYRYRIGDYRAIFDLDKDKIVVLKIGHRKEIYR